MPATNQVMLSEAVYHNRFSAEFFDPKYVFKPAATSMWLPIGRILKKCEYGISISMNVEGNGYPIFRMNEIDNCFARRPEKYAPIPKFVFEQYRLKENDILFNRTNSFEFVGRTGIVKDQTDCTFASYLIRLVPDQEIVLPEFLTVYLNTRFGVGQIKRRAMRSINQANVSGAEVKRILIPIVEIAKQQRVANTLNESFNAMGNSERLYAKAKKLLESELGLDKLNFQKPVGYTALFSELEQSRRADAEFYLPKYQLLVSLIRNRDYSTIGRLFSVSRGICLDPNIYRNIEGVPYIRIKELSLSQPLSPENSVKIPRQFFSNKFPTSINGDYILAVIGATIGKINLIDETMDGALYSNNTACLSPKVPLDWPNALELILRSPIVQYQVRQRMAKTAQEKISDPELKRILIPQLDSGIMFDLEKLCLDSKKKYFEAKRLLEQAKTRVEQLIEEAVSK